MISEGSRSLIYKYWEMTKRAQICMVDSSKSMYSLSNVNDPNTNLTSCLRLCETLDCNPSPAYTVITHQLPPVLYKDLYYGQPTLNQIRIIIYISFKKCNIQTFFVKSKRLLSSLLSTCWRG